MKRKKMSHPIVEHGVDADQINAYFKCVALNLTILALKAEIYDLHAHYQQEIERLKKDREEAICAKP